jgi:hypothetical protein
MVSRDSNFVTTNMRGDGNFRGDGIRGRDTRAQFSTDRQARVSTEGRGGWGDAQFRGSGGAEVRGSGMRAGAAVNGGGRGNGRGGMR